MLDNVVFGATGFVGRLVAEYLVKAAPEGVTIGLAGRSKEKLEALGLDLPLIVADSENPAELARAARVIATTVGPYRKRGIKLVDACVDAGSAYCDLTGEVLFARRASSATRRRKRPGCGSSTAAASTRSRPTSACFLLHQALGELADTTLVVKALRGGFSGGTFASMKGQLDELRSDSAARKAIGDPNLLSPGRSTREPDVTACTTTPSTAGSARS